MGQVAHAGAAELFLDGDAQQPQVAELAPQIAGEVVVAVDGFGAGSDLLPGKALDRVAELIDIRAEIEVEAFEYSGHGSPANPGRRTITKPERAGNLPGRRRVPPEWANIVVVGWISRRRIHRKVTEWFAGDRRMRFAYPYMDSPFLQA